MWRLHSFICHLGAIVYTLLTVMCDAVQFLMLCFRPAPTLATENLFLRKQLAQFQERQVKPRRADDATRITLVWVSRFFDWRKALVIVQPATLLRWHRQGFRWFWRWRSKPGRPALPKDVQALIRRMALDNPTWGQEGIANELLLKLGRECDMRKVLGSLRRECLDVVIPLNDKHLYSILKAWIGHYNQGRPHMSLGPGIPELTQMLPM